VAAIDGYLARMANYAASLSYESEREAAIYEATGTVSPLRNEWVGVKTDCTTFALQRYRERLRELAACGEYRGPTKLVRMTRDGTWLPLPLPELQT
jgi:hypothetical protein